MVSVAVGLVASAAVSYVSTALTTPKPPSSRPDNLSVLRSEVGTAIPKVYGRYKVTGNIICADNITKLGDGGKRGADTYGATFAVLLAEGVCDDFSKIWLNGKLVVNRYPDFTVDPTGAANTVAASTKFTNRYVGFYKGTANQVADAQLTALSNNSFTLRHRCYMVFYNFPFTDYGNAAPKVEVELLQSYGNEVTDVPISGVINDILLNKVGLPPTQFSTTKLAGLTVPGVLLAQNGQSAREIIEELQRLYQFTIVKSSGFLDFVPLPTGTPTVIDINNSDLGTRDNKNQIEQYRLSRIQENELPDTVKIDFVNAGNAFERGTRQAMRTTNSGYKNEDAFTTSVAITDTMASTLATKYLNQHWGSRGEIENINLPIAYNKLVNVNSLVRFAGIPETFNSIYIVTNKQFGANGIVNIKCRQYDVTSNNVTVPPIPVIQPPSFQYFGDPTAIAINTNMVYDTDLDYGMYVVSKKDTTSVPVTNGLLWASDNLAPYSIRNSWNNLHGVGQLATALPKIGHNTIDNTTEFDLVLSSGSLSFVNAIQWYANQQVLFINNELISVRDCQLIAPNTYRITNIIRGIRGSEKFVASHAVGSDVYIIKNSTALNTNAIDFGRSVTQLNQNVALKVTPSNELDGDNPNSTTIQYKPTRLYPYAPSDVQCIRRTSGIEFTWQRRTRKSGEWVEGNEEVLNVESSIGYIFTLYNGTNIVNTQTVNTNKISFTNAQLGAWGLSNNIKFSVTINQTSSIASKGYGVAVTVPISSIIA